MTDATLPIGLSEAGRARRAALKAELCRRVRARGVRARALRLASASLCAVLGAALVWQAVPGAGGPEPAGAAASWPAAAVQVVRDDPTLLERWRAEGTVDRSVFAGDGELLELLAAAGRPTGLVRCGGATWTTREVVGAMPVP